MEVLSLYIQSPYSLASFFSTCMAGSEWMKSNPQMWRTSRQASGLSVRAETCYFCGLYFEENSDTACKFHRGDLSGSYGSFSCCRRTYKNVGCMERAHLPISYSHIVGEGAQEFAKTRDLVKGKKLAATIKAHGWTIPAHKYVTSRIEEILLGIGNTKIYSLNILSLDSKSANARVLGNRKDKEKDNLLTELYS